MSIKEAFDNFKNSDDFYPAFDSSTKASWGGGGYSVELFDDGTYRVLDDNQIGNLYDSPGLILNIPALTDEEWPTAEQVEMGIQPFYEDAITLLVGGFGEHWQANQEVQAVIAMS